MRGSSYTGFTSSGLLIMVRLIRMTQIMRSYTMTLHRYWSRHPKQQKPNTIFIRHTLKNARLTFLIAMRPFSSKFTGLHNALRDELNTEFQVALVYVPAFVLILHGWLK